MKTKIKEKLKKIISILVCVMMIWVTCPVNLLSGAVFAQDDVQTQAIPNEVEVEDYGQEISLEGGSTILKAGNLPELEAKIDAAKDGNIIELTDDICATNSERYALKIRNKKITITSAEGIRKISLQSDGNLLEIEGENSDVTFKDIKIDGLNVERKNSLINVKKGSLNIGKNASISGCWSKGRGGAIYCDENGSVNVNGGEVINCYAHYGGAIYCVQGRIDITQGGKIANCRCSKLGDGGAIYCGEKAILEIGDGGKIFGCEALSGGAIACDGGEIKLGKDGLISDCRAGFGGAIIATSGSKLYVNPGGKISDCIARHDGGAIYLVGLNELYITGGEISNCSSVEHGGAVHFEHAGGLMNMTGGTISGCHSGRGGAIYAYGDRNTVFEILGGQIIDCWAKEAGNAIYLPGGILSLIDFNLDKLKIKKSTTADGVDLIPGRVGGYEGICIDLSNANFIIKNADENNVDNEISIGKTWYVSNITTLKNAVTKSCDGDVIVLIQGIEIPDSPLYDEYALTVKNKNITITADKPDLKITCNNEGGFLEIEGENSGVTLKNITVDGNNINRKEYIHFIAIREGNFNLLENAKIVNCDCDAGNIFCRDGKVDISGGTISNCRSRTDDGAIYLWNSELNVMDGSVIDSCHGKKGGFVYCSSGKVNFKGGSIYRCDADVNGGAVYFQSGTLEMTGGTISGCHAKDGGGAIYCLHGTLNICGGLISDCSALYGGAISCVNSDAILNMTGGRISQSFAHLGGGIHLSNDAIVNLERGAIVECRAIEHDGFFGRGNAVYNYSGILSLLDGRLPGLLISKTSNAQGIDSDSWQVGHHEGIYANKLRSIIHVTGGYIDDDNQNSNASFDPENTGSTSGGAGVGSGGGSGKVIPKNINMEDLGDIADTLFDANTIEEDKKDDDDIDMIDEDDEIENEKYEDEDDEIENDKGPGEKEKNDGLGVLVPWLIGAAVVAIGAVAVVFVLKNKGAN